MTGKDASKLIVLQKFSTNVLSLISGNFYLTSSKFLKFKIFLSRILDVKKKQHFNFHANFCIESVLDELIFYVIFISDNILEVMAKKL